jgi:type II secretory pathway pseudopilin PulG
MRFRKGQVWVETVIYTLIGLALIGLVLAILTPKIKEFRDRSVIEQTIESLNLFDSKITEVLDAPGNKRKINFRLDRGNIIINSSDDKIIYILDESNVRYSEPGFPLSIGRINVLTEELTETYKITLSLNYVHNLTYDSSDKNKGEFSPVSVPYQFFVENKGIVNNKNWIDITEGS